ncbi:hypothetical protein NC77_02440 [Janthinobacterium lividum]|uniref:hypothetical protein n=1 Tax=Janthinobacterium lividum TaxID=29581 RepID=UPI000538D3AF|nr:hypothetical protein [Janthinobacterium lividum]KHA80273.1 hypothetical protein NC77_02440 [Janthinobacterium lividum]
MTLTTSLNEFNKRFADVMLPFFSVEIEAMEDAYGMLCFRGPIPVPNNPAHVGTHVAVTLEKEVAEALANATPVEREEITQHLIENLGWQIRIQYDPAKIGLYALDIVGTMESVAAR